MSDSKCPKCGRAVSDEVICPACDYVLDTSFLGEDITDNERDQRMARQETANRLRSDIVFGEDDVILGNAVSAEFDSFASADTGFVQREATHARIYIGALTGAILAPDAIPARVEGVDPSTVRLNPFESHVLSFINGKRPVGRIRKKSGMAKDEVKTALAMLADKGVIQHGGIVSEERKARAREKRRERKRSARAQRHRDRAEATPAPSAPLTAAAEATRVVAPDAVSADPSVAPAPAAAEQQEWDDGGPSFDEATVAMALPPPPTGQNVAAGPAQAGEDEPPAAHDPPYAIEEEPGAASIFDAATGELDPNAAPFDDSDVPTGGLDDVDDQVDALDGQLSLIDEPETKVLLSRWPSEQGEDGVVDGLDIPAESMLLDADRGPSASKDTVFPLPQAGDDLADFGVHEEPTGIFDPNNVSAISLASDDFDEMSEPRPADVAPPPVPAAEDELPAGGDPLHDGDDPLLEDPQLLDDAPDDVSHTLAIDVSLSDVEESVSDIAPAAPDSVPDAGPVLRLPSAALQPVVSTAPPAPVVAPALPGAYVAAPPQEQEPQEDAIDWADDAPVAPPLSTVTNPVARIALKQVSGAEAEAIRRATLDESDEEDAALDDDESDDDAQAELSRDGPEVPFALRRKAENIFEQAEKDAAAGNYSSARMNAKLAMIYDAHNRNYKKKFEEWSGKGGSAAKQTAREVVLFQESKKAEARGDFAAAVKAVEDAIKIAPGAAPLYNRLGVLLATRMKDYRGASEHLLVACELAPQNLSFKNNLGKVLGMDDGQRKKEPKKWFQREKRDDDEMVRVKKMRPKVF